ncbi:MAG: hypothetical protein JW915_04405 [Chitinispirillaceae bacterium]|nr:hypothetical protein [Chitinispirillaceae bacterium]
MTKIKSCGIKGVIAGLALIISQAFPALISVSPERQNVAIGSMFDVNIMISGLVENEDLSTFDVNLSYDNSLLEFYSYKLTDQLGNLVSGDAVDVSDNALPGIVNIANLSLIDDLSFQSDAFNLATVTFKGIAEGISEIALKDGLFGDINGGFIDFTTKNGTANVPEASMVMLLSSGLLALSVVSFRKKTLHKKVF